MDEAPPCETCYPGVHSLNETAMAAWTRVKGQWVASPSGVSSINVCAIDIILRGMGIPEEERLHVTDQILTMGDVVIAETRREQEAGRTTGAKKR